MKKYKPQQIISIVTNTAKEYEKKLNKKNFMIIFSDHGKICVKFLNFYGRNYLHFTGLKTKHPNRVSVFYSACLNGKLSIRDIIIDESKCVYQKLAILPFLPNLLYGKCMIGNKDRKIHYVIHTHINLMITIKR